MKKVITSKASISMDSCTELRKKQFFLSIAKDTRRKKTPINKIPVLTKSMNMDIWVVGTSNQLFIRGF